MTARPLSVGVVGLGYWGPNIARTFDTMPGAQLRWLCDAKSSNLDRIRANHPDVASTADYALLLDDPGLDAIAIATPSSTHVQLARQALEAGKHVFIEKPLAHDARDAAALALLAETAGLQLMVGHVLLFHPAVVKLKELIETGRLGDVYYLYGNRQNLGRVRTDENALWSLGAHDVSVLLYLLNELPIEVSARGESYLHTGIADVVFCFLRFESGITAHLHLSWLDPQKFRRLTVVGSDRMAVFDDMEPKHKLAVYEKSAPPTPNAANDAQVQLRAAQHPRLASAEPLRLELEHFLAAIRDPRLSSGTMRSVDVVRVLAALQTSLQRRGATIRPRRPANGAQVVSLLR